MFSAFDNFPALLIWLPLIGAIICFVLKNEGTVKAWSVFSSILSLGVVGASLVYSGPEYNNLNQVSYVWLKTIGSSFTLVLDGMSKLLCLLTALAFPIIFIATYNRSYPGFNSFYGLMLLSQCGLMGVFMAMDALVFYFFWELALIPVYFLASLWGGEKRVQATFKFFIYTFAGSLLMLVGIIYLYLKSPDQSFSLIAFYNTGASLPNSDQYWLFWLFFVAFAIKMPVFPFHTWQPDVYEQSTSAVTMVMSGVMVKMGVFAVIRWLLPTFPAAAIYFDNVVIGLSVVGMIYASCIAIVQDDLKRLVAYSSIAHVGLMCAAAFAVNHAGIQGVMVQMFNHGINIIGLWIVVDLVEKKLGTRKISKLGGLAHHAPSLTILLVVIALANIALPLTNAFIGELLMFSGLYQFNAWYTAFAGLSIILAAVYMLNMIKNVFYGNYNTLTETITEIENHEKVILAVIVVLIFMVGFFPGPVLNLTNDISNSIIQRTLAK
jgi:NADH-quinone oxidoreductase subunit M